MKKKVIISACILGEYCRYDGKTKKFQNVIDTFKEYEIIPFCPEAPLFGTPREKINIIRKNNCDKIITEIHKQDVTKLLEEEIYRFVKENDSPHEIVLKSKSPSCGLNSTPIKNTQGEIVTYGDGIATRIFQKVYKNVAIKDENL